MVVQCSRCLSWLEHELRFPSTVPHQKTFLQVHSFLRHPIDHRLPSLPSLPLKFLSLQPSYNGNKQILRTHKANPMTSMCGRISQNLRSYDLGFYSRTQFCSPMMIPNKPISSSSFKPSKLSEPLQVRSLEAKSSGEVPIIVDSSSSQQGDECEVYPEGSASVAGGIVALGKFDALHIGHRELAVQASKSGTPFLLSFVGIAEVLGWEPRPPVVAKCDRKRVLSSWAPYCGNVAPAEYHVQFSCIRHLTPQQFVEKLAKELGVRGVVAGENYRFGYKAAGDASQLVRLCREYGIGAYIVTSVMDDNRVETSLDSKDKGQVSSTRVRSALAKGNIEYVSKLLGRNHRVMLMLTEQQLVSSDSGRMSAPKSCLLNLPPKEGLYENCSLFVDENMVVPCRATIDTTHIHVESHKPSEWMQTLFQDYRLLGIEFGAS